MRLVVTGGAGYIGSVVTQQLLEAGHDVTVVDDLSTGHADAVPQGAEFVECDVRDMARVLQHKAGHEGVLHFAAKSLVGESGTDPGRYWSNNVSGSLAVLQAMVQAGVERIVFSSSAATYGQPEESPITEEAPTRPTNAYGATKLAVDHMITNFCSTHGLAGVSLRYFNVAGAYRHLGERHAVETHIIPNALRVVAGQAAWLDVFGNDYPTPDGTCIRDYIHVEDLGQAHLLALAAARRGAHSIYNLGTGSGFSVQQVVAAVREVTGHELPVRIAPRRAGDPPSLVASSARARAALGWRPEKEDLRLMVRDAWRVMQTEVKHRRRADPIAPDRGDP